MTARGIAAAVAAATVAVAGVVGVGSAAESSAATAAPARTVKASSALSPVGAAGARGIVPSPHAMAASYRATRGRQLSARPTRAQSRQVAQLSFAHFTTRSRATLDMRGVEKSLYHGRFYRASVEPLRRCIETRESEGHYDVVSPSGLYFGAYQVSRPLARGATWMMLPEHKRLMGTRAARTTLRRLRSLPMNRWPRYWQDAAFHTIMNFEHTRSGAAHWAGGRWHC